MTEFTKAVASPLPLEAELRRLHESTSSEGLQVYDDGAGGARIVYARTLNNDESQEVEEVLAAHAVTSPLINYVELFSSATSYPGISSQGPGSSIHLSITAKGNTGVLQHNALWHLFRTPDGNTAFHVEGVTGLSSVNNLFLSPSEGASPIPFTIGGGQPNVGFNFVPNGTGRLQENGVNVALVSNKLSVFAATTSAELAGVISDETGTGLLVLGTNPVLTTPNLGTPSAITLTNATIPALSVWVANSANTVTQVTPGAGNSIRINAGGTAWEAYAPGAGVPTLITVANEAVDTTCFLLFVTAATGDLGPKTNAGLKYQADINALVVGGITASGISATSINSLTITTSTGTLTIPNGVVLTGPASSGTVMTLGNTETVTGIKTWQAAQAWNATSLFGGTAKATFYDADLFIGSSVDGQLDISADTVLSLGNAAGGNIGVGIVGETVTRDLAPQTASKMNLGTAALPFLDCRVGTITATGAVATGALTVTGAIIGSTTLALTGLIIKHNNISTVSNGVPSELATVDLATQAAAISATTIYTPAASGMFRISVVLQVTRAATTSSILGGATGVTITYTEPDGSVAQSIKPLLTSQAGAVVVPATGNTGNATTTQSQGVAIIYAKTGVAIQYAIGYTSVGATTMQFAAHLKVEAL
jgi:hypothetical protein